MNKSDLSLHRGALCWLVLVWTVGGLGGHALAQKKARPTIQQQKEASSQFSICREIAKEGDASGCWRVWLRKYKDIGSEAEVAYAEEHSVQVPEKLPENPETTKPKEPVKENPEKVGKEEQPNPEKKTPAEGQHGEDKPKDSDKDTQKDNSVPEAALLAQGNVLDFCSLKSSENSSKFVKKRVVLMAISSSERIEEDSSARSLHGANIAREVFSSRFPLGRFYNVVSSIPGDVNWTSGKTSIQVEDVVKHLENDSSKVTAEERKFISYSLKCTDFLAVPNLSESKIEWKEREISKGKEKRKVKIAELNMAGKLAIFKRSGNVFQRVALLEAAVPSMVDYATDATASSIPTISLPAVISSEMGLGLATKALRIPDFVSAVPDLDCLQTKVPSEILDGASNLKDCKKEGVGSIELARERVDERASDICKQAQEKADPVELLRCEIRVRSFQLARAFQKKARSVEGWKLFAQLGQGYQNEPNALTLPLGKDEGLGIGYGFQVLDANKNRIAYFKVTSLGPGGEVGETTPSLLSLRLGDAPVGSRVEEYPQLGIQINPYGSFSLLTSNYGTTRIVTGSRLIAHNLPNVVLGGGATVGYDLSSLLGWSESYIRIGAGVLVGGAAGTQLTMIPIETSFEKHWYLGRRTSMSSAIGWRHSEISLRILATDPLPEQTLSARVFGPQGKLGMDVLLHPDFSIRMEGVISVPVTVAKYESKENLPVDEAWLRRKDRFLTIGSNLVLGWTF